MSDGEIRTAFCQLYLNLRLKRLGSASLVAVEGLQIGQFVFISVSSATKSTPDFVKTLVSERECVWSLNIFAVYLVNAMEQTGVVSLGLARHGLAR